MDLVKNFLLMDLKKEFTSLFSICLIESNLDVISSNKKFSLRKLDFPHYIF